MQSQWDKKHKEYSKQGWIDSPNIFAETVLPYFKDCKNVLDLGAGQGQDSRYFAQNGLLVTSTDVSDEALKINRKKSKGLTSVKVQELDLNNKLPFKDDSFDAVYAHLSLHYFDLKTTKRVFSEACRVLKPKGVLALLVNSTSDPEYDTGKDLEKDYFEIGGKSKRFFRVDSLQELLNTLPLETRLLDSKGETYKDREKDVSNLIRYIGILHS